MNPCLGGTSGRPDLESNASLGYAANATYNRVLLNANGQVVTNLSQATKAYQLLWVKRQPLSGVDGNPLLRIFQPTGRGKVVLAVNVASRCGNTPQYAGLQSLFEKYKEQGLVVVGFPCNDFGKQEPGTNAEVKEFCSTKYKVTFPMMDKLHVKGPEQHALYKALTGEGAAFPGDVKWNFGKFLIARDGSVAARFEPGVEPDDAKVTKAIEDALAKK